MLAVNYLKVAWRNLMKSKVFSLINVFGLSIGLTCCMLIAVYLIHETSYDSNHANSARLYQVGTVFISEGVEHREGSSPSPLAAVMQEVFPQIEATARIKPLTEDDKTLFQYHGEGGEVLSLFEDKGILADSGFFKLFTYNFIEGDPSRAMADPYSIVLNEEIARKMFGSEPALGKVIHISSNTNGDHDYIVSGVFRPSPVPSHIDGRFFLSIYGGNYGDFLRRTTNLANNNQFYTYLLLKEGSDRQALERQFPAFVDRYEGKELRENGFYKKQFLLPVRDIHLHANTEGGYDISQNGSPTSLFILGSIAIFTLLIACINFMNLATARSSKRSSEVGVRKTLGAARSSLVYQFLGEALMMSMIAFALAMLMAYMFLPGFERMANRVIYLTLTQQLILGGVFFGLAILTGIISGSYPAFYLSAFQPIRVIKGKGAGTFAAASLRRGLVIFQFVISVILIVASVVIARQMKYVRQADLGFDKDRQLVIPLRSVTSRKLFTSLKDMLTKDPRVLSTGGSSYYPGIGNGSDQILFGEGKTINDGYDIELNYTDFDFLRTLGVRSLAGHLFTPRFPTDSVDGIILNEYAVKAMGYTTANAVGKHVYNTFQGQSQAYRIVGVVKDFHYADLHIPIVGYGIMVNSVFDRFNYMVVHLAPGDPAPVIASIGRTWKSLNPGEPFAYTFMDEAFQKNYDADTRLADIVSTFTAIAIFISCLGLFGLAAFSAEQRTKEIGIRKVLGASPGSIVALLSEDFLKLVGISIVVASPIAWWIMQRWLQDFAYHTGISWSVFVVTAGIALVIALVTISTQAIRAAVASPVKSLRSE